MGFMSGAQTYQLVWSDEFDTAIGPDWVFETGNNNGWGNNELQTYTSGANAAVVNGVLEITARKEGNGTVTSTRMKTQGKKSWQYGKVEARIKLPLFHGAFPAFWMLGDAISNGGWPKCGEIDIMENINSSMNTYGTIHYDDNGWQHIGGSTPTDPSQWHINTMIWDKDKVIWYLDGVEYNRYDLTNAKFDEFQAKFFILLNLAYRSNWTESQQPGATLANFPATPQVMSVDWVRVYQAEKVCGVDFVPVPAKIEAEDYCSMVGVVNSATTDLGGGTQMGGFDADDKLSYSLNIPNTAMYTVNYRVSSSVSTGSMQLEENGAALASINIPATTAWTTISQQVQLPAGNHTFALKVLSGGFDLNWISIQPANTTVVEAEDYDLGGANVSFYDVDATNKSGAYRSDAVDVEAHATGFNLSYVSNGEWTQYTLPNVLAGLYTIYVKTASNDAVTTKSINIKIDGVSVGTVTPTSTGGWATWQTLTLTGVTVAAAGQKVIRLEYAGGEFNVDNIQLVKSAVTSMRGVDERLANISIYPNPASHVLNVELAENEIDGQITLVDLSGSVLLSKTIEGSQNSLDITTLADGFYVVKISTSLASVSRTFIKRSH